MLKTRRASEHMPTESVPASSPLRTKRELMSAKVLRIGIVGCGAVTELAHLPVCAKTSGIKVTALVDPNVQRAQQLATKYQVDVVRPDTADIDGSIDAVILAAPHALHAQIAVD